MDKPGKDGAIFRVTFEDRWYSRNGDNINNDKTILVKPLSRNWLANIFGFNCWLECTIVEDFIPESVNDCFVYQFRLERTLKRAFGFIYKRLPYEAKDIDKTRVKFDKNEFIQL